MKKKFLLRETTTIGEYDSKEEAESDRDNNLLWHPENSYEVVKQEIED